jgi:hypothetical protein
LLDASGGVYSSATLWDIFYSNDVYEIRVEVLFTPIAYAVVTYMKRSEGLDIFDLATDFNPFRFFSSRRQEVAR